MTPGDRVLAAAAARGASGVVRSKAEPLLPTFVGQHGSPTSTERLVARA